MDAHAIDVVTTPEIISKIVEYAEKNSISVSSPLPTDSISDALDAPFGVEEVRQAAEIVTIIIGSGMSLITFLKAVRDFVRSADTTDDQEPKVEVRLTRSQRKIIEISKDTDVSTASI